MQRARFGQQEAVLTVFDPSIMASGTLALAVTSLVTAFLQRLPQPIPLLYDFPQTSEVGHCTQVSCVGQPIGDNQQI